MIRKTRNIPAKLAKRKSTSKDKRNHSPESSITRIRGDIVESGIICSDPSHDNTLPASSRLPRVLSLLDFTDHQVKRLGNVVVISGTGLGERGVELLGDLTAFLERNLALLGFEIALVADDGDGDPFSALTIGKKKLLLARILERY